MSLAQRALTRITGFVPPSGRWVLDKWAERVEVDSEDATGLQFTAHVLPPVGWRCALMMLMAGPEAWLDEPALDAEKGVLAERLLAHHGLDG
jgi:proteasome accessory factor C